MSVKNLKDLQIIKKPGGFTLKSCQLFCQLVFSFRKEFDIYNPDSFAFGDWPEILKFLAVSPKAFQECQNLKQKIENLEYNFKFVLMMKGEYYNHVKILKSQG